VAGTRVGRDLSWSLPEEVAIAEDDDRGALLDASYRVALRSCMSKHVGVVRSGDGLATADDVLHDLLSRVSSDVVPNRKSFEATNLLTIALGVVASAQQRTESRGCHRRSDHVSSLDSWKHHTCLVQDHGQIRITS
jgi:L-aspartate oxidase